MQQFPECITPCQHCFTFHLYTFVAVCFIFCCLYNYEHKILWLTEVETGIKIRFNMHSNWLSRMLTFQPNTIEKQHFLTFYNKILYSYIASAEYVFIIISKSFNLVAMATNLVANFNPERYKFKCIHHNGNKIVLLDACATP